MIVRLTPAYKHALWGGTRLVREWHKHSPDPCVSETWELSCHAGGLSVISDGPHAGCPLRDVIGDADLGKNCKNLPFFPVLIKLIDTAKPLSVQVHPSDEYALAREGSYGKTEMWHILAADPGAYLYLGFSRDLTREELARAVSKGTLSDFLNKVPVRAGETYFIDAGMVHAIGAGITLLEVQQNSDLTYRLYDWGRTDANGKPRELHVAKALDVVTLARYEVPDPARGELLGACRYFLTRRFSGKALVGDPDSFTSLTVTEGTVRLAGAEYVRGETVFLSAGESAWAEGGSFVTVTVPDVQGLS